MTPVLLVFLDGVGLGADDPAHNPLARARLPTLTELLEGARPVLSSAPFQGSRASLVPLDAVLDVPGIPQSGTGQTALLTGTNAPALFGRHFGPWVPTSLRSLLRRTSILNRAREAGLRVAFANAYPEELLRGELPGRAATPSGSAQAGIGRGHRGATLALRAGPPVAALGAGVLNRHAAELARGDAVASEITNRGWRDRLGHREVPDISVAGAGANLARIAARHDLTLFAHYSTDGAGHGGSLEAGTAAMECVDAFLGGVLAHLPASTTLVVVSDHGNLEDIRTGHTRNPALGLVVGSVHGSVAADWRSLTDVAPALLALPHAGSPGQAQARDGEGRERGR